MVYMVYICNNNNNNNNNGYFYVLFLRRAHSPVIEKKKFLREALFKQTELVKAVSSIK